MGQHQNKDCRVMLIKRIRKKTIQSKYPPNTQIIKNKSSLKLKKQKRSKKKKLVFKWINHSLKNKNIGAWVTNSNQESTIQILLE